MARPITPSTLSGASADDAPFSTFDIDAEPLSEILSYGVGEPPLGYLSADPRSPRGMLAAAIVTKLRDQRSYATRTSKLHDELRVLAEESSKADRQIGELMAALRKLDKGTPYEDHQ